MGKIAVVTGGAHGIGKAIVIDLLRENYKVMFLDKNKDDLDKTYKKIKGLGECIPYNGDITEISFIYSTINDIIDRYGKIDLLVNNVGGCGSWGEKLRPHEFGEWEEVFNINFWSAVYMTNMCIPHMKNGKVISIGSIHGKEAGGRPWFNASKSALISFMKNMSKEYDFITFNTISPGHIDVGKPFLGKPLKVGKPEDIAKAVVFIANSDHMNGANIVVDGGVTNSY